MKTMNRIHAALAVAVAALSLQACVPALVVGGATTGVLMAAGAPVGDAVHIANEAAGVVVGKLGTAVVTPEELF